MTESDGRLSNFISQARLLSRSYTTQHGSYFPLAFRGCALSKTLLKQVVTLTGQLRCNCLFVEGLSWLVARVLLLSSYLSSFRTFSCTTRRSIVNHTSVANAAVRMTNSSRLLVYLQASRASMKDTRARLFVRTALRLARVPSHRAALEQSKHVRIPVCRIYFFLHSVQGLRSTLAITCTLLRGEKQR